MRLSSFRASCLVFALCLNPLPALPEATSIWDFKQEIDDIVAAKGAKNPQEAYANCKTLEAKLSKRANGIAVQRLYGEAMMAKCILFALDDGKFSDETGDVCTHHFIYASKLADIIRQSGSLGPEYSEAISDVGLELKRALALVKHDGCKGDYAALENVQPVQPKASAKPEQEGFSWPFLDEISKAARTGTGTSPQDRYKQCTALGQRLAARSDISDLQRLLGGALISGCLSWAMKDGGFSDATGTACSHGFDYAKNITKFFGMAKNHPSYDADMLSLLQLDFGNVIEATKTMGCSDDFEGLTQR